jgi:PKD repeat protein
MLNSAFGSIGSAASNAPYHKGRTTTHEVGHWLGLRHIWGDANCANDFCNDTPTAQQSNFGCPTHPYKVGVCGGNTTGEMFQNFMDYTDDLCMYMFTTDQRTRIQTTMANGTYRTLLTTSAGTLCTIAPATPTANFSMNTTGCTNSAVVTNNTTNGTPIPTYVWSANPSTGVTFVPNNTATSPSINFTTPGSYSITVVATNSLGSNTSVKPITITTCTTATICNDTLTNVTSTGTLLPNAAGSDTATPGCSPKAGYIMGSNCYDDKEKAEFFSTSLYSGIASPQIKSVIVIFYKDGTKGTGGNSATAVNLKLYNGTMVSGPTGTASPIATVTANIGSILAVTATNSANYVGSSSIVYTNPILRPFKYTLTTPVNAPTTNGFFASVTTPTAAGDTAVIMDDGSLAAGTNWELWSDNSWHSISVAWSGYDASMAILPVIQCGTITAIGNNSILNTNISLHPNPSNGIVNVITTLPSSQNLDITVSNALGQVISATKHSDISNNVLTIDLNSYSSGVYFVTFNNGQEKIVKRVILNK